MGTDSGHAFIWRQALGIVDLQTLLAPPTGWTLTEARAVSVDGMTIMGTGNLVGVGAQAWIATLGCPAVVKEVSPTLNLTGAAVTALNWSDLAGPFNVYRGTGSGVWSYNQTCFAEAAHGPVLDPAVPLPGTFLYYLVARKDVCGDESVLGYSASGTPNPNLQPCP